MTLTASDVVSLKSALGCWEWADYTSIAIVGLGCVGEFVAEFTKIRDEKWRHKLAKLSTIVVIIGIAGELTATVRTSELSGQIIANVEENAAGANERAAKEERARTVMLLQLQPR
jgi:homoserine dehydrogenase